MDGGEWVSKKISSILYIQVDITQPASHLEKNLFLRGYLFLVFTFFQIKNKKMKKT